MNSPTTKTNRSVRIFRTSSPEELHNLRVAAIADAQRDVEEFHGKVTHLPLPDRPTALKGVQLIFRLGVLEEEVDEFRDACAKDDVVGAADGLVDLIYFALGGLLEMGVPFRPVWDEVQEANMEKEQGELARRPGSLGYDAVKPEGWEPPNHSWLLSVTSADIANLVIDKSTGRSATGADKYDDGKPPLSLIPREALEEEARVFAFGERKYDTWNWMRGLSYRRLLDSAFRHLVAFADGEDLDPESGLGHLGHLRCCTAMLIGMQRLHPELDDRRGKR